MRIELRADGLYKSFDDIYAVDILNSGITELFVFSTDNSEPPLLPANIITAQT